MALPVFYQTLNMVGVDPTLYYTNLATAGGSVTPEYPAPPFILGTQAFGSDGSQFIFVQASTSISLTDFVVISAGTNVAPYTANAITTANAGSANGTNIPVALGATGLIVRQSVTIIPAGAMFWACTKGNFIPATTSANQASFLGPVTTSPGSVALYTSTSPGELQTAATVATSVGNVAFAGIVVISSISVSIPGSVVPPVGTLSATGFTVGPVVSLNNPRTILVTGLQGSGASATVYW